MYQIVVRDGDGPHGYHSWRVTTKASLHHRALTDPRCDLHAALESLVRRVLETFKFTKTNYMYISLNKRLAFVTSQRWIFLHCISCCCCYCCCCWARVWVSCNIHYQHHYCYYHGHCGGGTEDDVVALVTVEVAVEADTMAIRILIVTLKVHGNDVV